MHIHLMLLLLLLLLLAVLVVFMWSDELGCSRINDTFMNNQMVLVKIY